MRCPTAITVAAVAGCASLLAACGAGPGQQAEGVELLVTRDFGASELVRTPSPQRAGGDTVMRFLQRNAKVDTRYGGGFVQRIDGLAGGEKNGRRVDWFYFVNGVEAEKGATAVKVRDGHRIWWDHHDWGVTSTIPAVVGSFPEPFRTGWQGRRLPVRIECADQQGEACDAIYKRFTRLGIVSARGGLGTSGGDTTLRVLVGPWDKLQARDAFAKNLGRGPKRSGVFARFLDGGSTLQTLNGRGAPIRRLGAGTGLIAAGRDGVNQPTWVVTGTDDAGVDAAVPALDEGTLTGKFAYAISDGRGVALPERMQAGKVR